MKKKIFLSYKWENEEIARSLKAILESYNYEALVDADKSYSGGNWRIEMMTALKNADAVVAIYTEDALRSQYIPGEIGMARAYRDMGNDIIIIPLIISIPLPPFLSDLNSIFVNSPSIEDLSKASKKINDAITKQSASKRIYPRIFISHLHKQQEVVQSLVDVLESAFNIREEDMRCTSVPPYKLPIGAQTSERLKEELNKAQVVLGIISPDVEESQYTMFELGASWGKNASTFPLLISGATPDDVPGPLKEKNCISLSNEENCWQLIEELKKNTTLIYQNQNETKTRRLLKVLTEVVVKHSPR